MKKVLLALIGTAMVLVVCWWLYHHYEHRDRPGFASLHSAIVTPAGIDHKSTRATRVADRYSVIPGGVSCGDVAAIVAAYPGFNSTKCRVTNLSAPLDVYVAYRRHGKIYWTSQKIHLKEGEEIVTDGQFFIRARCGNDTSIAPKQPNETVPPSTAELETPEPTRSIATLSMGSAQFPPAGPFSKPPDKGPGEPPPTVPGQSYPPGYIEPVIIGGGAGVVGGLLINQPPTKPVVAVPESSTAIELFSGLGAFLLFVFIRRHHILKKP